MTTMPTETLLALVSLAIGTLFTPGPNNAMLAGSGASFGFRRSLPHLLGVAIGFPAMLLVVGLALGALFQASGVLREAMRWGGAALLLWMAWKIARSGAAAGKAGRPRPMTFAEAAARGAPAMTPRSANAGSSFRAGSGSGWRWRG
jgi:threonine/homoserine/homoserine lactone efflux protein